MHEIDFNYYSTLISIISLIIAVYVCYQNYRINKQALRAYVYLYLVSTKNATYIKVKNFGRSPAVLLSFETDIDIEKSKKIENRDYFPYVGLKDINIAPGASKIAIISNYLLNKNHWMSVTYLDELTGKKYTHRIELNTYNKYALVSEKDFDIIDY